MTEKILERAPLIVGEPIGVLAVAVTLAIVLLAVRRRRGVERVPLPTAIRAGAVVVVVGWALDLLVRRLAVVYPGIAWWAYAVPLAAAAVVLGIGAGRRGAGARRRGEPTVVGVRRSWSTFVDRRLLTGGVVLAVVLGVTTVAAGLSSSPDEFGRWALLVFGDGGATSFYGWAYGLPVLVALAVLVAVVGLCLRGIAAPPFTAERPVSDERARRRAASDAVVSVSLAAVALSAGEVFQFVGRAGSGAVGAGIPGVGTFMWTTPYSAFAEAFFWGGWALSVGAIVALLALGRGRLPGELVAWRVPTRPRPEVPAR